MKTAPTLVAVMALAALAGAAQAGITYSTVNEPPKPEELNHAEILSMIYGGTFTPAGVHYSNGGVTATRVVDFGQGGPLELFCGSPQVPDQVWTGGPASLVARAKYAGDNAAFGWRDDTSGGAFQELLNTATLDVPVAFSGSSSFRWALNDLRTGRNFTSRVSDNLSNPADLSSSTHDQMVAYQISGLDTNDCVWVLFWEDRIEGQDFDDYDFNDAVIEVRAVPTPGSLALLGMGGALMARRRRR